ncbi:MAG: urea transporter permease subunit UrtB [Pseudomonadota bacterium]
MSILACWRKLLHRLMSILMSMRMLLVTATALPCLLLVPAWASTEVPTLASSLQALAADDPDARVLAVGQIATLGGKGKNHAQAVLTAILNDGVFIASDGKVWLLQEGKAFDPVNGSSSAVPTEGQALMVNNRLRRAVQAALAGMKLFAPDLKTRQAAVQALQADADAVPQVLLEQALRSETDRSLRQALQVLVASKNLQAPDAKLRLAAVLALADSNDAKLKPLLQNLLAKNPDGSMQEPDPAVRSAAAINLRQLETRLERIELLGNLFYGLSLGSVLLLTALGLAITFGLMGIINMAHGEMLMIGAYTTWLCQGWFRHYWPGAIDGYLLLALPMAFIVTACVGMLLERSVIRWLYGRPLETLLATWGISLMLMQAVRSVFGAQNVEVANPVWMSGGVTVFGSLVLPFNRIAIIIFSLLVLLAVWLILHKTRLGLFLRAVTQNRRMADCVGVPTGRVDMLTFGLGSGIAGLGGVALSQLGNVGPDLGQAYIIDSFMVVVLGGVGQLAGTVLAALGLGELNKLLEPWAGAVMAKIAILGLIIIFIQRRPQGLFAQKGRSVE